MEESQLTQIKYQSHDPDNNPIGDRGVKELSKVDLSGLTELSIGIDNGMQLVLD